MPKRCSTRGCLRSPMWAIEIRGPGTTSTLYYSCDHHCRQWCDHLGPHDNMQYLGETTYDQMVARSERYREMSANGIDLFDLDGPEH